MRRGDVTYRNIFVCLMACIFFGCADSEAQGGDAGSEGTTLDADAPAAGADEGETLASDPCDDCPDGSFCEDGECSYGGGDGHYDCGGGVYCENGQIWQIPMGDAPDAVDPCAPSLMETCAHGCDAQGDIDPYDDSTWCLPAPCSPEALGLEGTPVDFTVLTLTCEEGDPEPEPAEGAEPESLVIATSIEALAEAVAPCTASEVDFETQRVAVIRGYSENTPDNPSWVLDVAGTLHIEVTFQPFSSGIEVLSEPYTLAVALPAGDAPITAQECRIPYEGPEVP